MKIFTVFYNDGVYYGTFEFHTDDNNIIEKEIQKEIDDNNKNPNPLYHITRENFKEVLCNG
jgi:hypothetical protein